MKLYITPGSPYARMARIAVLEKGLQDRVEIIVAKTRTAGSPYYDINPSGRVPYLVCENGVAFEESAVICAYLDQLQGKPALKAAGKPWEAERLEGLARSMVDGISVWNRELARPETERSPTVIRHEKERARRMADVWEREIDHPLMRGPLNMIQMTLACGLGLEVRNADFRWRPGRPKLVRWFDEIAARPSFVATAPPSDPAAAYPAALSNAAKRLIGTWRLVSAVNSPYGKWRGGKPSGLIHYDANGYMGVQIMPSRPRRKFASFLPTAEEAHDALLGYTAYFGTYTVDEKNRTVTHHRQGNVNPSALGDYVRRYEFVSDDTVVLKPVESGSGLTWERIK